ncbi:MAG: EAL domain-containing protein [Acholeplasmatales bacterium]|nr:EAL domain-containing protein [Acholeplasmatales bacterium]
MVSFQVSGIALIFLIFLFYLSQKRLTLRTGQIFVTSAILVILLLVVDIFSIVYASYGESNQVVAEYICKLYLAILLPVSMLGLVYILRDRFKYSPKNRRIMYIILTIIAIGAAVAIFLVDINIVKDVEEEIFYTEGTSCYICYGVCGAVLLATIVLAFANKGKVQTAKRRTIIAWMAIWVVAALIQFFVKQLLIVSFAASIGLIIIYIMLENPALSIDKETSCFNSNIFNEYMIQLFGSKKKFKLVYVILNEKDGSVDFKQKALINLADALSSYTNRKFFTESNKYLTFRNQYGFVVVLKNVEINDFFQRFNKYLDEYKVKYADAYDIKYLLYDNNFIDNYKEFKHLVKEVLNNSDIITYKNDKYFIDNNTIKKIENNIVMEGIIKNAIEKDLVEVYYQPIYSKEKNKITSAEALVRIRDGSGAILYPDSFIELAEKNGLISKLGELVFIHVCRFIGMNDIKALGLDYIEVNLSVVQCGDPNLANRYIEIMKKINVSPDCINLEITETASTNLRNIMINNMNTLINYGVHFSLDDFGMGNSNLNYIIEMPVDIVKFDRILVNSYFTDPKAKLVITRIIEMIKALNLEIVLEGIENKESLDEVLKLDIDFIQGYYFSKPVQEIDFVEYVKKYNKA